MKKVTIKNLKAGQTIWYPAYVWRPSMKSARGIYELKSMTVLSDKAEEVPPWIIASGQPRNFLRGCLKERACPPFQSFSRRKVLSWIRLHGRNL